MEIIKPDRREWLVNQFVLAVLSDGDWHRDVSDVPWDCFGIFATRTRGYIDRLSAQFDIPIDRVEKGFVLAECWTGCTAIDNKVDLTPEWFTDRYPGISYFSTDERKGVLQSIDGAQATPEKLLDEVQQHITNAAGHFAKVDAQLNQAKDPIMKTETIAINTVTYINGADISKMTSDQLIDAIQTCEAEIEALAKIKTQSKAITAKVDRINATIAQLVTFLDGDDSSAA